HHRSGNGLDVGAHVWPRIVHAVARSELQDIRILQLRVKFVLGDVIVEAEVTGDGCSRLRLLRRAGTWRPNGDIEAGDDLNETRAARSLSAPDPCIQIQLPRGRYAGRRLLKDKVPADE